MTHKDPSIFPEPEKFDPERFSEQRAEDKKVPYSFIPFGGGARQCLGMGKELNEKSYAIRTCKIRAKDNDCTISSRLRMENIWKNFQKCVPS